MGPSGEYGHSVSAGHAPVVEALNVTKGYGAHPVLTGIDLTIPPGITGLLGTNGAGKTTLLGLLLGLHRADGGQLRVLGNDPWSSGPETRARMGYAPEHHDLPPDMPAVDFVRHMAEIHGLPRRAATGRASDTLFLVGLGEERARPLGSMSTGQRQRVKLAQAIAHDPSLVLLDEPTDGLDPAQRDAMLALITTVGNELGISMILSSHLLHEVERTCTNIVVLADGKVSRSGKLSELKGEGSGLTIVLDETPETTNSVAQRLHQAGLDVAVDHRRLTIRSGRTDPAHLNHITSGHLIDAGVSVRSLANQTVTLADVVLGDDSTHALTAADATTTSGAAPGEPPAGRVQP